MAAILIQDTQGPSHLQPRVTSSYARGVVALNRAGIALAVDEG